MRLTDILSKPLTSKFEQVEGFLNNTKLKCGRQKKIKAGKIALNYFCRNCDIDMKMNTNEIKWEEVEKLQEYNCIDKTGFQWELKSASLLDSSIWGG